MPVCNGDIRAYIGFLVVNVKARGGETSQGTRRGAVIRCLTLRWQVVTTARRRRCRSRVNRTVFLKAILVILAILVIYFWRVILVRNFFLSLSLCVSVASQIHPEFLRLLWVLADKQMRNYYALIGVEEEIGNEAFTWSRARTLSFEKNCIGKAIAYANATCFHLSVHSTAPPALCQAGQPMSSAECFMHGAVHASHRAPPRPAVNVGVGAHSVAPSAHGTRAGASGVADMVADSTHAAGGVAAAE